MNADRFVCRAVILLGILSLAIPSAHAADGEAVRSLLVAILLTAVGGAIVVRILAKWAHEWLTQRRIRSVVKTFSRPTSLRKFARRIN